MKSFNFYLVSIFYFFVFFNGAWSKWASQSDFAVQGNVTWFQNCSGEVNKGKVVSVTLTKCANESCVLEAGEPLRLVLNFIAGASYDNLLYQVRLVNLNASSNYLLAQGSGVWEVQQGEEYSIGTDFRINETIPEGQNYSLQVLRYGWTDNSTEVCAVFKIGGVSNDLPTPTPAPTTEEASTTEPTEETEATTVQTNTTTTTTGPASSTSHPIYDCEQPGTFPDPHDCHIFHVCTLFPNGTIWDQQLHCAGDTVYCDRVKKCEYEPICPCNLSYFW